MIVVSNSGPIIALAKIGELPLLKRISIETSVPTEVERELLVKSGPEREAIRNALGNFITVRPPLPDFATEGELGRLDEGERQVILLAKCTAGSPLILLDDKAGREAARKLHLSYTGTAGMLLIAKRRSLVTKVVPLLELMRDRGYWLSDAVIESARKMAGE